MRFAKNIVMHRVDKPEINDAIVVNFAGFLISLVANAMPNTVDSSARAFIEAPTGSPLRMRIPSKATVDVIVPDVNPKSIQESTIGTPVKSNFK